ncbi:protein laeA [Aspergillus nidulans FGSC A4]|uniref:Protein-methionine methyltransferase laeA n=2 Tax=Emericella nidulans TaxID=162425 RepID=LAEA_EMENI|nr:protein laeA [Aspergillus nidulans FGSC A4]C8VQG9.1 RecName: Full=Protein-methionine methyltransferase laeA; AltName: Full=Secondary metabolism regulator laeA; AltName: Full=Velvet complex subunit laeA [Aspergillus nidulans FGSC A4]Q6TLK5.1 RecName: Full=Secondary metabolism regulator laeA; AltName: Full=Methyltransferase laeA; AltName: Full=Velvet complex subunit laeA [Aspergillus nidulans]AAQ95166.1 methyltransferase [Aspergillus nidulans]CBF88745.1 TPA: Methyltransferase [Source:UniProtKB
MFEMGPVGTRLPAMTSPAHNHYSYHSPTSSDRGRSRQNSDAMDIQSITEREPATRYAVAGGPAPWNRNGSPSMSPMYSNNSERNQFHEENGRTYHGFRRGMYFLPCDEQEQDRLDIFHKLFTVARVSESLIYAPHPTNGRFLDLGCGTGIWAIEVANKYPDAFVAGVDLAPIQPPNHPKNCEFYAPFDFEAPWAMGEDSWDLIHLQMGCGSVMGWPNLYRRIFAHLRPGAWFEQVEIDFEPRCDDRSLDGTALRHWYDCLKQATAETMRPIAHSSRDTIKDLQDAGFTEIDHQIVGLPLNPWHQDEHERKVARWYNLAVSESIENLSLAPFSRVYRWPLERIQQLAADVKSEAFNKEIHAYNILHIYQARKPLR